VLTDSNRDILALVLKLITRHQLFTRAQHNRVTFKGCIDFAAWNSDFDNIANKSLIIYTYVRGLERPSHAKKSYYSGDLLQGDFHKHSHNKFWFVMIVLKKNSESTKLLKQFLELYKKLFSIARFGLTPIKWDFYAIK
jgi:hypothetical protein